MRKEMFQLNEIGPPFIEAGFDGFIIRITIDVQSGSRIRDFQPHEPCFQEGRNALLQIVLGDPSAEIPHRNFTSQPRKE
jgi:hypothetical protein